MTNPMIVPIADFPCNNGKLRLDLDLRQAVLRLHFPADLPRYVTIYSNDEQWDELLASDPDASVGTSYLIFAFFTAPRSGTSMHDSFEFEWQATSHDGIQLAVSWNGKFYLIDNGRAFLKVMERALADLEKLQNAYFDLEKEFDQMRLETAWDVINDLMTKAVL